MKRFLTFFLIVIFASATAFSWTEYKSIKELKKKAEKGDVAAQFHLGSAYYYGKSDNKGNTIYRDYSKAVVWWEKAAQNDLANAQYNLYTFYSDGKAVKQDYHKATYWLNKLVKQSDYGFRSAGNYLLGCAYYYGLGVDKNPKISVELLSKLDDSYKPIKLDNDYNYVYPTKAPWILACCYYQGIGVEQNYMKAVYYFKKAADLGIIPAYRILGECYEMGKGVQKDFQQAFQLYKKGSDKDDAEAQYILGMCYLGSRDIGLEENQKNAFELFYKAANHKNYPSVDAMVMLSTCYKYGMGTQRDEYKETYWRNKAIEYGDYTIKNHFLELEAYVDNLKQNPILK